MSHNDIQWTDDEKERISQDFRDKLNGEMVKDPNMDPLIVTLKIRSLSDRGDNQDDNSFSMNYVIDNVCMFSDFWNIMNDSKDFMQEVIDRALSEFIQNVFAVYDWFI